MLLILSNIHECIIDYLLLLQQKIKIGYDTHINSYIEFFSKTN
jgi:hypothetical protein